MAHLHYHSYKGFGTSKREELWYSQAVRIGNTIELAGQGGWDPHTSLIPPSQSITSEISRAFANVQHCLLDAGGSGWSEVYKVRLYLTEISDEVFAACVGNLKRWCPDHRPVLTAVGVTNLGLEGMRVEIEVKAHVGGEGEGREREKAGEERIVG